MSLADQLLGRTTILADRASDRLNPILVKETRQAAQGTLFSTVYLLLVGISWLVLLFGTLAMWEAHETQPTAEIFWAWYYGVLSFAAFVVVPFGTYRSLLTERESHTLDLLTITSLTPKQIIRGKLSTSLVQAAVYSSAIAPFIAFTSMLQGFDTAWVVWVLAMSVLWCMALCVGSLATGVASRHNQWQSANLVGLIVLLMIAWIVVLTFVLGGGQREVDFEDADFWWVNLAGVLLVLSYILLAGQIVIARLTFAAANRSTGIRLVLVGQFWTAAVVLGVMYLLDHSIFRDHSFLPVVSLLALIQWAVIGLFLTSESDFLSRRIRRRLPARRLSRLLVYPLLPGGTSGLALVYVHLVVIAVLAFAMSVLKSSALDVGRAHVVLSLVATVAMWVGISALLGRKLRKLSHRFTPVHTRVLVVVLFVAIQLITMVPTMFTRSVGMFGRAWTGWNPFLLTDVIWDASRARDVPGGVMAACLLLAASTIVSILVNVPALIASVKSVVVTEPPMQSHSVASPTMASTESADAT